MASSSNCLSPFRVSLLPLGKDPILNMVFEALLARPLPAPTAPLCPCQLAPSFPSPLHLMPTHLSAGPPPPQSFPIQTTGCWLSMPVGHSAGDNQAWDILRAGDTELGISSMLMTAEAPDVGVLPACRERRWLAQGPGDTGT